MSGTETLNHFSSDRAVLHIDKLPNVSILTQNFNIPTITVNEAIQVTPTMNLPLPGDKMIFEDLMVEFILDENFEAWKEVHNWILSLVNPQCSSKFKSDDSKTCDGKIIIYNSHNNVIATLSFYDLWPNILSEVDVTEEDSETVYKKVSVTFKYTLYTVD